MTPTTDTQEIKTTQEIPPATNPGQQTTGTLSGKPTASQPPIPSKEIFISMGVVLAISILILYIWVRKARSQ